MVAVAGKKYGKTGVLGVLPLKGGFVLCRLGGIIPAAGEMNP